MDLYNNVKRMIMEAVETYNVQIWCGLRERYTGKVHTLDEVRETID